MHPLPRFFRTCLFAMVALSGSSCREKTAPATAQVHDEPTEDLRSIEADASFVTESIGQRNAPTYFTLKTGPKDGSLSMFCPPLLDSIARERPGPQRYRIEFWAIGESTRESDGSLCTTTEATELSKLTQGSTVLYDASVCEVHKCLMERRKYEILPGPQFSDFWEKQRTTFPHGRYAVSLGCAIGGSPEFAHWWCCPECFAAEKAGLQSAQQIGSAGGSSLDSDKSSAQLPSQ